MSSNIVVIPTREAGDSFGQAQSVSCRKVRKDALHLPKPTPARIQIPNERRNQYLKSIFNSLFLHGNKYWKLETINCSEIRFPGETVG